MTKHDVFKRTLAGILAVLTVAGYIPANVGTGGLSGSTAITASAVEYTTGSVNSSSLKNGDTVKAGVTINLTDNIGIQNVRWDGSTDVVHPAYNHTNTSFDYDVAVVNESGNFLDKSVVDVKKVGAISSESITAKSDTVSAAASYKPSVQYTYAANDFFKETIDLTEGTEYVITSIKDSDNVILDTVTKAGTYAVTIEGKNWLSGTATFTWQLNVDLPTLSAENVTIADFTYDGTEKTPVLTYDGTELVKDTDYTVDTTSDTSATNAGTYTIKVNGIGDYAGENVALTWKINKIDYTAEEIAAMKPTANTVYYTGKAQTLIEIPTNLPDGVSIGLKESDKKLNASQLWGSIYGDGGWIASSEQTEIGTYYYYFLIHGDNNHNDYPNTTEFTDDDAEFLCLTAEIVSKPTNLTLHNLGNDVLVTDSKGTEITDTSALTVGTYYIYTNKSIADSDVTEALSMGYKKNQTYNGTKYQYRYEIEVPEVPEDGYVLSHTNNWVGKVETSNTSVLLIGEDGVFGNIGAELKGEGTYYYGDQPSADSVQITDGFESVVSVGEVYFAQANGTKVETPEIGKSYYLTAEVFVDKSAEIEDPNEDTSVFYLKQKVNYVKRPLEKCEVYLKNGETETKLTVKNGAVTIPANTFTYNGTAQKPEIVIKNNVLGTETTLTSSDYTDTLEEKTDAGNYSATFTATDDASYTGSLTVNWSIAKATATVTAEPVENIIYDGAPLDKTDFTFTDENNVLNSADAVLTIEGNNGGDITNAGERTAKFTITSRNYNNIVFTVDADIQKRNVKVIPADGQSIIYGTEEAPVISITTEKAVDADDNGEWDTKTGVIPADVETVDFVPTITIKDFDYTYFRNNANTYKYEVSDHVLDNYIAILDGTAIFTVEPKELTEEMFDIWEVDYTFDGTKKLAPKFEFSDGYFKDRYKTNKLTANDFTVGGTDHAVLPGTYTLEFSGQNNYTALVSFDWEIKPIREYSIYASVESKTYDGKTVIPTSYLYETADADKTPVTTIKGVKTTCTYYEYDGTSSITEEYVSGLTALNGAPKDAGTYLLKVSKTAKGYAFEDYYTTFTISQKEIAVTPNATGKIFGEFDPDFTDFSYDESAVIEGETPKITGAYALDEYEGNVGTYSYNIGTIEIDDNNYYLTISGNYVVKPQELTDKNLIIFKECTVGDDGWSYPGDCIKVTGIVNGEEIELIRPVYDENTGEYINTDFQFISATKTKKIGEFSVQIQGIGNYTGLAEAIVNVQQGKHQVTVKNGAFANGETSAYFADGAIAVATADNPADGYKFGYWKKNGSTISYNPTYTFFVTSDNIELEAVYVEDTDDIERYGNAVIESVTPDKENKKIQFVSLLNVPEGCKILKAGIVATSDETKSANLTDENADFVRYGENLTVRNYKYTWTKNNVNETWYVKGYLVYEDANGETKTVYSDLTKATLDGYETIEEEKILGTAVMESVTPDAEEKKIQFVAMLSVPADCTINKAGIVATSDATKAENLTADNADFVRTGTTTKHGYRYTWTKSNVNETWYVRPYLVYTSANGKEYTVYGDLATGTLN